MVQNKLRVYKERNQSIFNARRAKTVNKNRQTASVTNQLIELSVTTNKTAPIKVVTKFQSAQRKYLWILTIICYLHV
jgi:hypothetical protein